MEMWQIVLISFGVTLGVVLAKYGLDAAGKASSWSNESSAAVPSQTLATDIAVNSITAEKYYEVRQTVYCNWDQTAGAYQNVDRYFSLPSETTNVVNLRIVYVGANISWTGTKPTGWKLYFHNGTQWVTDPLLELTDPLYNGVGFVMCLNEDLNGAITDGGIKTLRIRSTSGGTGWTGTFTILMEVKVDITA